MKIYLIRHGEIARKTAMIGRTDLGLSSQGKDEIASVASFLGSQKIGALYTSPLLRCRQSSNIIAEVCHLKPIIDEDLIEIDLGVWDGMCKKDIQRNYPHEFKHRGENLAHYRPDGGESFTDVAKRVIPCFYRIAEKEKRSTTEAIAIVAHAGVNRAFLAHIVDKPLSEIFSIPQEYGSITILSYKENFVVEKYLSVSDL